MKNCFRLILPVCLLAATTNTALARELTHTQANFIPSFMPIPDCLLAIGVLIGVVILLVRRRKQTEEVEIDKYTQ